MKLPILICDDGNDTLLNKHRFGGSPVDQLSI